MLAANHKTILIIIKNRHCRVLNGQGLPDVEAGAAWRRARSRKIMLFCAEVSLPVAAAKLFCALRLFRVGVKCVLPALAMLCWAVNSRHEPRSDGGKDSGA